MATVELIGVPFDGYGRPGNQASAAAVLRAAGLAAAFAGHDVIDDGDLDLPAGEGTRGQRTSLINEPALVAMTEILRPRIAESVAEERFPFVYGGDCTTLLGTVGLALAVPSRSRYPHVDRLRILLRSPRRRTGLDVPVSGPHDLLRW